MNPLQSHPEWIVILLAVIGGWLLGRASAPSPKRLRRRLEEAEEAHARTREQASRDLANANRIIRETMAERDAARGTNHVAEHDERNDGEHATGHDAVVAAGATTAGAALFAGQHESAAERDEESEIEPEAPLPAGDGMPEPVEPVEEDEAPRSVTFAVPDPGAILPIPIETAPVEEDAVTATQEPAASQEEGAVEQRDSTAAFPEADEDPDLAPETAAPAADTPEPAPDAPRARPVAQSAARPAFPEAAATVNDPEARPNWQVA